MGDWQPPPSRSERARAERRAQARAAQAEQQRALRAEQQQHPHHGRWRATTDGPRMDAIPQTVILDRDRRLQAARECEPTPSQMLLGDPMPLRSALEQKSAVLLRR
jgi:hypothetical protein